ncbi:PilZ domain-containing protein [Vibrio europaeus]|uniref:Cyclic diguanosine monophosphate-binding protein n=1 Tax=Vibrio europaeus TaxID=300876 RepID=A0A178JCC9_9VIBR|nr:PilZ domain-containing protein [Vibrio europaeus]MDC5704073.1 PilZ domain-containing protein [Vibrio europaeus]MDC5708146.1 PilZ domain-containing protein [Vibrio europaeus]MDC5714659.1 PilZ domain-containing protein [Vibrio europaeus]MDC5718539.1 PilZ domain-containing protein [Vibrio europaeus]MDC5725244.1 PilZ domain-containing protein [Vibrio europaeus]
MIERRRFSRIVYQAQATLTQESTEVIALVCDLSLHGLLATSEQSDQLDTDKQVDVEFSLAGSDVTIQLVGNIVGLNNNVIRVSIDHIDIESIGHLKRLVELNVGDDDLLHRDIEHLSDLGEYT